MHSVIQVGGRGTGRGRGRHQRGRGRRDTEVIGRKMVEECGTKLLEKEMKDSIEYKQGCTANKVETGSVGTRTIPVIAWKPSHS